MKRLLFLTLFIPANLMAATVMVTNTNDAGAGSLRQAVLSASPGDTVKMDPLLIAAGSQTINLLSEINVNKALYIQGIFTSYDTLYISGQNACRIFTVSASGTVTLYGCTLVKGYSSGGGAINHTAGTLVIDHCNLMYNHSTGYGGAISKSGGTIQVMHSHLFYNTSVSYGGAVYLPPGSGHTFSYCTFYNNHSDDYGGAMYGFVANTDFDHCTFVGNDATTQGGAIYDWGSAVVLNLTNCTVVGNTSASVGGIECWGSSIVFTITSSIVTGNTAPANLDIWGAGAMLNSGGYNYIGDASYAGAVGTDNLSVTLASLNLTALQDNGSYTYTRMPQAGSPAINDGNPADVTDAQNATITDGMRDAGAAEYYACPDKRSSFFAHACSTYTVPSGNATYNTPGLTIAMDTIPTSCGADSVMTIYIYIGDILAPVPDMATLPDINAECTATPTAPTATDACVGAITGTTTTTFPITTPGLTVITWTYDDGLGNTSTQTQNVNITPIDVSVTQTGITLTANSTGSTYQWLDCNNGFAPVPTATNQSFTPAIDGSYACAITNGTCSDTTACY
ncbi:MAG TPA: choice-of-anchor Q domain-containing protein, partial [Flavobacteriales bacterium]|nr:choice-of-anchor Q domain-containing protein [Flavobacteriales bacterium]